MEDVHKLKEKNTSSFSNRIELNDKITYLDNGHRVK